MADQVLKTVRITDNIKVEVLQQGKKRKYVIFYDGDTEFITTRGRSKYEETDKNNNTKSEKYDIAMSDDDVIEMALKDYNSRFGSYSKKFSITQNIYSDPAPARTYGNGDKSPYYLNNGCAINIQWIGKIPNPEFNPGTYSNLYDAERDGKRDGKPRYLENSTITSTTDNADNSDTLPKSSWSVSPPVIFDDDPFGNSSTGTLVSAGQEVPVDYRDTSYVQDKIVTVTLSKGFTENDGKGYLVWTNHGLQYNTKALPNGTEYQKNVLVDAQGNIVDPEKYDDLTQEDLRKLRPVTVTTSGDIIENFRNDNKDSDIVSRVIEKFKNMVSQLHGISNNDYDLKLCAPDNETCSLIPYKSPLESPAKANDLQTPPGPTPSNANTKIKFTIDGLPTEIILKAKEDLDTFTIWTGPIPKINNGSGNIDDFEDGEDDEYTETNFEGDGENIVTQEELKAEIRAAIEDAKSVVDDSSTSNNGITVKGLAPNSPLPANAGVPAGFNGVPLYNQFDPRWANSPYNTGGKCASKTVSSSGCGPTAVSMVINFWAAKGKCNPVTPAVVAKFCADNGAFVCNGGSSFDGLNKEKFKNTFGITMKTGVTEAQIMAALKKGYPCVMSGASYRGYNFKGEKIGVPFGTERYHGGHVVCLTGIDSQGRIRVNDSGCSPTGGKGITAFIEGKNPSGGVGEFRQRLILYPSNMSSPIA